MKKEELMGYITPDTVLSPKALISDLSVVYDGGIEEWSLAEMKWGSEEVLGIRWNGSSDSPIGNPQSRGIATWFILPSALNEAILVKVNEIKESA
ncbi:hypothetical protein Barb4_03819 [Bacteroidales bacterium Barb4]|nr:hypothetical protein Barb4_05149 [Bacteroidales bacterium Barb4]OAV64839.1 hypothetical protein Barb4_03819 [Bacteroidales bacterium Barb4]